ncbi:MAG: ectonucleotide pyrophosphatase/phosphodiesterase [Clostridium sp.]
MRDQHLILLSLDGFSTKDFEYAKTLPNFKELINNGSFVRAAESIYPSLTYPAHATVVTGLYPSEHGVINNTLIEKKQGDKDWFWYRDYIKADTIYDAAKRKGLKTSAILWPVSAGADIDYNLPEIWSTKKGENTTLKILKNSSKLYSLDLFFRFNSLRRGIKQPYLDDFVCESACYTIKSKKPNLLMIHLIDLDTQKHLNGITSTNVVDAINRFDKRIAKIVKALKEANIYENTTIIAFGDHSQLDARYKIRPNALFREKGLIRIRDNGDIESDCYFYSCDGSGYIYVDNESKKDEVLNILNSLKDKGYIDSILKDGCVNKDRANKFATYMIEASNGYYFVDDIYNDVVEDTKEYLGIHGYNPKIENYKSPIIFSGNKILKGKEISWGRIVDIAGTVSSILNLDLQNPYKGKINSVIK